MTQFTKTFYIYATSPAELLALKANDPDNPPNLYCSDNPQMGEHGWIFLQEHKVSAEILFHDSLIADAVTVVNSAKAQLLADTTDKLRVLDEAINKLLCLEAPAPVKRATSLEDAYDEPVHCVTDEDPDDKPF